MKSEILIRIENKYRDMCISALAKLQTNLFENIKKVESDIHAATIVEKGTDPKIIDTIVKVSLDQAVADRMLREAKINFTKSFYKTIEDIKNLDISQI